MRIRIYFSELVGGNKYYEDYIAVSFGQARIQFFQKHNFETSRIDSVWQLDDIGNLDKKLYPIIAKDIKIVYVVYHGWAFPEKVAEFKTLKEAIAFIKNQECPDDWCYEKLVKH